MNIQKTVRAGSPLLRAEKSTNKGKFINGIGKHGDDLISLLEINSVVDDNA